MVQDELTGAPVAETLADQEWVGRNKVLWWTIIDLLLAPFGLRLVNKVDTREWFENGYRRIEATSKPYWTVERRG